MHRVQHLTHLTEHEIPLRRRQMNRGAPVGRFARPAAREEIADYGDGNEPKRNGNGSKFVFHKLVRFTIDLD